MNKFADHRRVFSRLVGEFLLTPFLLVKTHQNHARKVKPKIAFPSFSRILKLSNRLHECVSAGHLATPFLPILAFSLSTWLRLLGTSPCFSCFHMRASRPRQSQ